MEEKSKANHEDRTGAIHFKTGAKEAFDLQLFADCDNAVAGANEADIEKIPINLNQTNNQNNSQNNTQTNNNDQEARSNTDLNLKQRSRRSDLRRFRYKREDERSYKREDERKYKREDERKYRRDCDRDRDCDC